MADLRDLLASAADEPLGGFDPEGIRARLEQRSRRRRVAGALGAVLLAGGAAVGLGLGSEDTSRDPDVYAGQQTSTDPAPSTSGSTPTSATATTQRTTGTEAPGTTGGSSEPGGAELEDGRHFGYVVAYEADALRFDLAQLFTGDEADRAAAEDGIVAEGEEVDGDVHVRNVNTRLRRLELSPAATITVVDCSATCTSVAGDRAALAARPTPTPVWLTVDGGVVTSVEEQYLP